MQSDRKPSSIAIVSLSHCFFVNAWGSHCEVLVLDRIHDRRPRIAAREARSVECAVDLQADVELGRHRLAVELAQLPGLVEREILLLRRQRLGRFVLVVGAACAAKAAAGARARRGRSPPAAKWLSCCSVPNIPSLSPRIVRLGYSQRLGRAQRRPPAGKARVFAAPRLALARAPAPHHISVDAGPFRDASPPAPPHGALAGHVASIRRI